MPNGRGMGFFAELKRRNVYRAAVAYGVVAWFLTQLTTQVFPFFDIPHSAIRFVVIALALGFPIAMGLAWIYEFTPEGIVRSEDLDPAKARSARRLTGRVLDFIIIGVLLLVIAMLLYQRFPFHAETGEIISQKSIAVLPFENLSDNKEDAFFADGIQDDVLTSLGKIKDLKVIGRASVMAYRGAAGSGKLHGIGKTLGVAHILQGSVRRSADRVVVNVQLIDARDERQLWSERYDRTMPDALSLQGELALKIARELHATLSPVEKSIVAAKPTDNADAYMLYLRGRELETRMVGAQEDLAAAGRIYQQAIDLDPNFALARARLSMTLSRSGGSNLSAAEAKRPLVEAEEALRIKPYLGEARLALAAYQMWRENAFEAALAELARAEELMPNSAEVWQMRAMIYKRQDKLRERIVALQHAETLDPHETSVIGLLAVTFMAVREWPEAIRTTERLKAISPALYEAEMLRAWAEFRMTAVLDALKKSVAQPSPGTSPALLNLMRYQIAMLERDYPAAERFLPEIPPEIFQRSPRSHSKAMNAALLTVARDADPTTTENALLNARRDEEQQRDPDLGTLALIDAFRGRKEDAIRDGRRFVDEVHYSEIEKNEAAANLALIYARTGEPEQAIKLIEKLLTAPASLYDLFVFSMTLSDLKWRWVWDPLRSDPRFQKILAGSEPKTNYQ